MAEALLRQRLEQRDSIRATVAATGAPRTLVYRQAVRLIRAAEDQR